MTDLRFVAAQLDDLGRYIDVLEEVAAWLEARGIKQWPLGNFRRSATYYAGSIGRQEVQLVFLDGDLVGTLRMLLHEPIVWPDTSLNDAVYVYNLAVRRAWANQGLGHRLLAWAQEHAVGLGRQYVRLDCLVGNDFLRRYYGQSGFAERGEIDAQFPAPVGTLRVRRFEKRVLAV